MGTKKGAGYSSNYATEATMQMNIGFKQAFLRDLFPVTGIVFLFFFLMVIDNSETKVDGFWIEHSISGISAAWFLIEIVTAALNKKRRAFHDYIAGTVVVKL